MDNKNKINSLMNSIFLKSSTQSLLTYSYLLQDDKKINELIQIIPQLTEKEDIDLLMNTLIDNFTEIRMNAARFVHTSTEDIYHILFDLFLSFDNINPPQSILNCLEILLMYGYSNRFNLNWLFTQTAMKMRNEDVSTTYLSNFFKIIKYFYGYNKNNQDIQTLTDHSLNYFSFFPTQNKSNGILLFIEKNTNFNFHKSIGISTWFKFPFKKNNLNQAKEILSNEIIEIIKIPFGNDTHITIQMIFNSKDSSSWFLIFQKNKDTELQLRTRNNYNDEMIHLYLEINSNTIKMWINKNKMETPCIDSFPMHKINKLKFYYNFFGEVYSLVIYSNPIEINNTTSDYSHENIINYNEYYTSFFNYHKPFKINPCLVYFPYGKGENLCKAYPNNMDYSLMLPKRGSFIYNYYCHKDTINKYYGVNALLPIFEYLYTHASLPNVPDLINSFIESVQMFPLYGQTKRIENLNKDFFYVISMFLEKMPNRYFNELFGKRLFNSLDNFVVYNKRLFVDYANNIFLNELILRKYGSDFNPWGFVNVMKQSSENGIKTLELLSINQLLNALLAYDSNCYKKFCCSFHKNALLNKSNNTTAANEMEPNLKHKIKPLVFLIISKMKIKKDIIVNQTETNESNAFNANEEQKEQMEKYQDLLLVSKTLSLTHSPCMTLQLLHIMKECFSTYDKAIFQNCKLAMNSPFLEVKNKCIDLLIRFIHSDNTHLEHYKIGKLINDFFLPFIGLNYQDNKTAYFTTEYIDQSVDNTLNILINWLLPLSKEIKVPIYSISEEVEDENKKGIIQSFKVLIEKIISKMAADNNIFNPFIRKLTSSLFQKLKSIHYNEINKLNLLCDKNYFSNKLHCIIKNNKDESGLGICYANSIILYYHLITSTFSISEIADQFQIILPILLAKNSSECSQQSPCNLVYYNIIEETLKLYMNIYQSNACDIQNHIIDLISVSFNYFIFIINYNKQNHDIINESELYFGFLNLSQTKDESWRNFNREVLNHFSTFWIQKKFEYTRDTIPQVFDDIITNITKEDINRYQNEINALIRVKQEKKGLLPLMIIISLIYINEIINTNETERLIFIQEYKRFLFYLTILSIYELNTINQQIIQTYFFEAIVLGLSILDSLKSNDKIGKDSLEGLIRCFIHFNKQLKGFKELNSKQNNIFGLFVNKKTEEKAILLLALLFSEQKSTPSNNNQPHIVNDENTNKLYQQKIQKKSKSIIENYHQQIPMFIANKTKIILDKHDDELKKLRQENIDYFITNQEALINKLFIEERKKRMRYYKIKKGLFSWNGPWSERELFYETYNEKEANKPSALNRLKMKVLNHYSKSFTRPFLVPILDIEYQLPHFTLYDSSNLFQADESLQTTTITHMNINDIIDSNSTNNATLYDEVKEESIILYTLLGEPDAFFLKQQAYKNDATNSIPSKETCELLTQIRNESNSSCTCCLVKSSHHIKGTFLIENNCIEFNPFINRDFYTSSFEENDIDYDTKKQTCFGSYIRNFKKDYNKTSLTIPLNSIICIFQRSYLFRNSGMEIFTNENKSYYFNFQSENKKNEMYSAFEKVLSEKVFVLSFKELDNPYFDFIHKEWAKGGKSNLYFLMLLNLSANRSFNDLSQYPVFPWIITDYSSLNIPNQKTDYRDLSIPIGMMTLKSKPKSYERQQEYLANYDNLDDSNEAFFPPYYYGSFYSNPLYVTHYLVRLFPMSVITIEIQGNKFDDPNRLFFSVEQSFENAITQKGDVRELVPEFYFLPEMFVNLNNFNYGILRNKTKVHDVECPLWSNRDPYKFVVLMRKFFEDDNVSSQLNLWIDLIFGYKQRGEEAKEAKNVYVSTGYNNNLKIQNRTESVEFQYRIAEFGLIPKQLFSNPIEAKSKRQMSILKMNVNQITCNTIEKYSILLNKNHKTTPIRMITLNKLFFRDSNDEIYSFTNKSNNTYERNSFSFGLKFPILDNNNNTIAPLITNKMNKFQEDNSAILILDQGNSILRGGFFDGNLLYSTKVNSIIINTNSNSPVCILTVAKDETIILAGTENGSIIYLKKCPNRPPALVRTIYPHQMQIINIFISIELNAFASTSNDDYVHIYILPKMKMVRSLEIKGSELVFLSESPLASIAIYSSTLEVFLCYSINGCLLKTVQQEKPITPRVFKDSSFFDYLISLTSNNQIYIQSFPYLDKVLIVNISQSLYSDIFIYDVEDNLKSITLYSETKQELYRLKDFQ